MKIIKKWQKKLVSMMLCFQVMGLVSLQGAINPKDSGPLVKQLKVLHQKLSRLKNNLTTLSKRLGELKQILVTGAKPAPTPSIQRLDPSLVAAAEAQIAIYDKEAVRLKAEAKNYRDTARWFEREGLGTPQEIANLKQKVRENNIEALDFEYKADQLRRKLAAGIVESGDGTSTPVPIVPPVVPPVTPLPPVPPTPQPTISQAPNVGLVNANGNDCFFSAAFQVLSQIKPFVEALEALPKKSDVQREFLDFIQSLRGKGTGKYKPGVDATAVFRRFITEDRWGDPLWNLGQYRHVLRKVNNVIQRDSNRDPIYDKVTARNEQCDAQEFLSDFLYLLTNDNVPLRTLFILSEKSMFTNLDTRQTRFTSIEASMYLLLPIVTGYEPNLKKFSSLESCLTEYFKVEILHSDEQVRWIENGPKVPSSKQLVLCTPLPKILTIGLRRFLYGNLAQKINDPVTFPSELNLGQFAESKKSSLYRLFGIVVHDGGTGGGHYRAYTKDRFDGKWREYDDATYPTGRLLAAGEIEQIAHQTKEPGTPYMLFYEKAT